MTNPLNYILPVYSNGFCIGCGVIVGKYFITSGHLIKGDTCISVNDCRICLNAQNSVICKEIDDGVDYTSDQAIDIAAFIIDGEGSPLSLDTKVPSIGDRLICYSKTFHTRSIRKGKSFLDSETEEYFDVFQCEGVVSRILEEGLFECDMEQPCKEGHSGSPIMMGNQVVGILCGDIEGKDSSNKVLFQPVSVFNSRVLS